MVRKVGVSSEDFFFSLELVSRLVCSEISLAGRVGRTSFRMLVGCSFPCLCSVSRW